MTPRRPKVKHQLLLTALACGATVEAAAHRAGLSERTAYRLLATPEFRAQLQAAETEMVQRTAGMLTAGALEASKTAIRLVQGAASEHVQLGAARLILQQGHQARRDRSIADRLSALEENGRRLEERLDPPRTEP